MGAPFTMDEEELKERLDRLRSRHGLMTEAGRVEPDDFVTLDSESDTPKFQKTNLNLRVGRGLFSPELEQAILGMAPGETQELALPEARARVTIRSVKRRVLPPLTDETVAAWGLEGISTLAELIASVDRGLILGGFSGGQPGTNGEFSGVAKNSFLIENGKIKGAVTETMVNGNLGEVVRNIRGISKELKCDGGSVVPYIAVDGIVISGK